LLTGKSGKSSGPNGMLAYKRTPPSPEQRRKALRRADLENSRERHVGTLAAPEVLIWPEAIAPSEALPLKADNACLAHKQPSRASSRASHSR
jgi:hypothetical protein